MSTLTLPLKDFLSEVDTGSKPEDFIDNVITYLNGAEVRQSVEARVQYKFARTSVAGHSDPGPGGLNSAPARSRHIPESRSFLGKGSKEGRWSVQPDTDGQLQSGVRAIDRAGRGQPVRSQRRVSGRCKKRQVLALSYRCP